MTEDIRAELDKFRDQLKSVRDAGIIAHGVDGKNGRLSDVRSGLTQLKSMLWSIAAGVGLSLVLSGWQSCVVAERRATALEAKVEALESAMIKVGSQIGETNSRVERIQDRLAGARP